MNGSQIRPNLRLVGAEDDAASAGPSHPPAPPSTPTRVAGADRPVQPVVRPGVAGAGFGRGVRAEGVGGVGGAGGGGGVSRPTGGLPGRWWMEKGDESGGVIRLSRVGAGAGGGVLRRAGGGGANVVADVEGASSAAAVRRENAAAAALDPLDARWILAVRAAQTVEGGRAAVLTPDRRRQLVALGGRLGLRAFDTNLIIAIVQDAARSGEDVRRRLGDEVRARLTLVAPAEVRQEKGERGEVMTALLGRLLAAGGMAVVMVWGLIRWVVGG